MDELNDDDEAFCDDADAEEILNIDDKDFVDELVDDIDDVELDTFNHDNNDEPTRDDSIFSHHEHTDEVFCVCSNPQNSNIVASGGKDDKAIVWNISTQKTLFTCLGHKESIVAISFSSDGSLLATGDLNGIVKVWRVDTGLEEWSFEVEEIQWLCWHHKATLLLAGTSDGNVWLWHVPFTQTKTLPSHGSSALCGKFMPDGKHACCGYEDGIVRIWDLKSASFVCSIDTRIKGVESSILCIEAHPNGHLVIAGSTDGTAILINPHNGQILSRLKSKNEEKKNVDENDDQNENSNRIETVAFSTLDICKNFLITGNGRGEVNIWDISSHISRHNLQIHESDIIKVMWHPNLPHILSVSADGAVIVQDARSGELVAEFLGHKGPVLDFDVSRDGNHVISCGEDHTVRIFKLNLN